MSSESPSSGRLGIFGLSRQPEQAKVVLLPAPWEATVSYHRGTAAGPAAILEASHQVELFDPETGRPYRHGIAMLASPAAIERTSTQTRALVERALQASTQGRQSEAESLWQEIDQRCQWLNQQVEQHVAYWLRQGKLVGVIGGEHSVALGAIAATAEHYGPLGVLQFDAHADLRRAYQGFAFSHASVMRQVITGLPAVTRLVQVGVRDFCGAEQRFQQRAGVVSFGDVVIARRKQEGEPFRRIAQDIAAALPEQVYVSFDIDGLDPALCPHTGTPVPGGLSFHETTGILLAVVESGRRIVGFDLCEVAPGPADSWDGNVGARILYKLIGFALWSWGLGP